MDLVKEKCIKLLFLFQMYFKEVLFRKINNKEGNI